MNLLMQSFTGLSVLLCLFMFDSTKTSTGKNNCDSYKCDTQQVNTLLRNGANLLKSDPDKAFKNCNNAVKISEISGYKKGLVDAYCLEAMYYSGSKNDLPAAIKTYERADSICQMNSGREFAESSGIISHALGTIQLRQGNYLDALQFLLKASVRLDSLGNKTTLIKTYNNLSTLYMLLKQPDKAEIYAKECLLLAEKNNDQHLISSASSNLAAIQIEQKKYSDVLPYLVRAEKIARSGNDNYILELCYYNMGMYYYSYLNDYKSAIFYTQKALKNASDMNNLWEEARIYINLAGFYAANSQYNEAGECAKKALELSKRLNFKDLEQRAYFFLAESQAFDSNFKSAYKNLSESYSLRDTVFKEENREQINNLETQYQADKKAKEILLLQKEKKISLLILKRRNVEITALITIIILLSGIAVLVTRHFYHKRIIEKKEKDIRGYKIKELENEKILLATQSVLTGEENERKRIARDLHDSLGGMLNSARTSLNWFRNNNGLSENKELCLTTDLINTSIKELRRVARNMMPETLIKLGMKDTLDDFCRETGKVHGKDITFQFFGEFERVDQNLEINSFRVVQELVNNSVRHSDATNILVQMIQENGRLCLIVTDNGKGFDMSRIDSGAGFGLGNIKSRVELYKGSLDINTAPGKGVEVTVEFILDKT